MEYRERNFDVNTTKIAQDNITPNLTRICPICFEEWTGKGAQIIYHILQKHQEYLIKREENYEDDTELDGENKYNEYLFTLMENNSEADDDFILKNNKSLSESNEIVKIFIEYEKIFILSVDKFAEENKNHGFNITVNYIGPYMSKNDAIKFTTMLEYDLNNKKFLSSISDMVGETAEFIIEEDMDQFKKAISQWPVTIKVQINVPKKFQELIDAMKSRLTCFRCKVMMQPPIRHCRYGHIICKNCRQKIQSRPICPSCHYNAIDFHGKNNLSHELHPAMYQSQKKKDVSEICQSAVINKIHGTGDVLPTIDNLKLNNNQEELDGFKLRIGHLRLLEEEALQIAYCCEEENCKIWISCLDLEEHKKLCHQFNID